MQFDIRRLDIYRKIPKDLTQPTLTGAAVSVCSLLFILFLFVSELFLFLTVHVDSELYVDDPVQHSEKIPVFINITLPFMHCDFVGLDIQDEMGRHEVGISSDTKKEPIDEVGCRFECNFLINKVPGNFHVSTHAASSQPREPSMVHIIHELRFGMPLHYTKGEKSHYLSEERGSFNPMHELDRTSAKSLATHDYTIRVVPTVHEDTRGNLRFPYQYTYSYRDMIKYGHGGGGIMPAIWFRYDLSPITVKYTETRKPFYTFLTTICAIIGGTFTVAGIIDSLIFSATELIRKAELGKLS